jgi:signal transduction histidine kinase
VDQPVQAWNSVAVTVSATPASGSELEQELRARSVSDKSKPADSALTAGKQQGGESPAGQARPTLLVVDDESDVLSSVRDLLRLQYRVVTFQRGADALEYLKSNPNVDVILSDQRMPEMSGVEVLRQARAIRPETTRLLFTAYSDLHTVIDAINQGHVFRYVTKPCEPDFLAAVMNQAVEHHNLIVEKNQLLADLRETNAKLVEANRLKEAFIEVASHELNTPITVVLGMIELWKLASNQRTSTKERQWVDRIAAAAVRLARTVERMLKLVRNRDFSQSLDKELAELEPVARRAVEEVSPYLAIRNQTVSIDIEPALGPVEIDTSKISDVLINLLANAVKFTPDGGTIRLEARAEPAAPGWVRVQVSDQGVGVAVADQQHLFEPFFTGFDTLCHSSGDYEFGKRGIGLGLWLVKTFVELHGGRVEVSSTPGEGSTFAFLLPRTRATAKSATKAERDVRPTGDSLDDSGSDWPTAV